MFARLELIVLTSALLVATPVLAGAPDPGNRNGGLAHECKGGTNKDGPCDPANGDEDCPKGTCIFKFNQKSYNATLTAVFDDFVTPPGTESTANGAALTVLLDMKANGKKRTFAETYSDGFNEMTFGVWNDPVSEANLVGEQGSDFLSQNPQGKLADELRSFLGETGTPVIVEASKKIGKTDSRGNPSCVGAGDPEPCCTGAGTGSCSASSFLGSVIKLKVKIRFVAPS